MMKWMEGKEGFHGNGKPIAPRPLPPPAAIEKIMLRDLTVEIPEGDPETDQAKYNMDLMVLYVDRLLPNATGP